MVLIITFPECCPIIVRGIACWISCSVRHRSTEWIPWLILYWWYRHVSSNNPLNLIISWPRRTRCLWHFWLVPILTQMEITRQHAIIPLSQHVLLLVAHVPFWPVGDRVMVKCTAIHEDLIFVVHEWVHLHLAASSVAQTLVVRSAIEFGVVTVYLAVFNKIVDLENLIAGLRFQIHLIVSHLI